MGHEQAHLLGAWSDNDMLGGDLLNDRGIGEGIQQSFIFNRILSGVLSEEAGQRVIATAGRLVQHA